MGAYTENIIGNYSKVRLQRTISCSSCTSERELSTLSLALEKERICTFLSQLTAFECSKYDHRPVEKYIKQRDSSGEQELLFSPFRDGNRKQSPGLPPHRLCVHDILHNSRSSHLYYSTNG